MLVERVTVDHLVAGSNPARRKFLHYTCHKTLVQNSLAQTTNRNYHLLTETEGNSVFCGPKTVDVSRGEAEGNIDGRGHRIRNK